MIYSVKGELQSAAPSDAHYLAVVEAGGIGYAIKTTHTTMMKMPPIGSTALFYTYLYVREDALELFGFADLEELNCFKMLISISGVGPKAALSILSDMTPQKFALYIATGDSKGFTRSKGIGAKTAQRIVLELKDKITNEQVAVGVTDKLPDMEQISSNAGEAISALVVLGYAQSEAAAAIAKLDQNLSVEDMIKLGLKALAGRL